MLTPVGNSTQIYETEGPVWVDNGEKLGYI